VAESTARAFAGTWRDEATGEVRGYSFGGTICWFPRKPWALKISRDGFDHVIRCGECPGCLEFDRRRLADRLRRRYASGSAQDAAARTTQAQPSAADAVSNARGLFIVRIYAPLADHARLSHALHRRKGLELEPGFYRLGTSSFGLLARSRACVGSVLRHLGLEFRVEAVRLSRGRRAWRGLTAGILVARDAYGDQVKRWYCRGLPPAEREEWEVERRAMQKPWQRASGARARNSGRVVLVPPEVWKLRRADRRNFLREYSAARTPEAVSRFVELLANALGDPSRAFKPKPPAEGRLEPEKVQAGFREIARRMNARRTDQSDSGSSPPTSEVGGYVSSEHSGVAPPAEKSAWESYQDAKAAALERARRKDAELFERFAKLGEKKR
jgi:hypothetical protein